MKKIFSFVFAVALTTSLWATTYTPQPGENAISSLMSSLQDGDSIVLSQGDYTEWNTLDFTTKVTIIAAEGATVNLGIYDLEIQNDFEINGINVHNISVDNYLFHVSAAVPGTIAFKNCTMKVSDKTITTETPHIYVSATGQGTMIIDNCVFMPNTKGQGSVVYAGSKTITNFTMKNSTVYGCAKQSVYCEGITNALIDHCTFYNTAGQILYIKGTLTTCAVKNCIFAASETITDNCIKTYGGTVDHCMYYNLSSPRDGVTISDCASGNPLFVDAANANFKLGLGSPAIGAASDASNLGDPRWGVVEQTVVDVPGTLANDAALLTGGISLTDGNLVWKSVKDSTANYATWKVNATKAGRYQVIVNESGSGHNFSVCLLDGETVVATAAEGKNSWDHGDLILDTILIDNLGQYTLRLNNYKEWSSSTVNAVKLNYLGGGTMAIPGLLPADEAVLAGKVIRLENGSFQWPNKSDVASHYATWNVTADDEGEVDVYAYIGNGSGRKLTVALYDGETQLSSVSQTETTYDEGEVKLGTITVEDAGTYTICLTNATAWSSVIIDSLVVKVAEGPIEITLDETDTENADLTTYLDKTVNVNLTRSMPVGMFSTICLPFGASKSGQFVGAKIYYLDSTYIKGEDEVVLCFKENSDFYQGIPYIIEPATLVANPRFENVVIKKPTAGKTEKEHAIFQGTYFTKHLEAGNENLLFLGQNNTLYFPKSGDTESMKGLRAYFEIKQAPGAPIRRASIKMGTDVVTTLDLVNGQAIPNGKFMLNGQIIIRANGQNYMLNGMTR